MRNGKRQWQESRYSETGVGSHDEIEQQQQVSDQESHMQHTCAETAAMEIMVVEGSVNDWAGQSATRMRQGGAVEGRRGVTV